ADRAALPRRSGEDPADPGEVVEAAPIQVEGDAHRRRRRQPRARRRGAGCACPAPARRPPPCWRAARRLDRGERPRAPCPAMPWPTDLAFHRARIEADGFTILEDAIEPALVDALAADLARLERELRIEPAKNVFEGARTRRVYNLLARGSLYQAVPVHPNVLPLVESVLDRGCLVSSTPSIRIDPGETAQPLHADDQHIPLPRPHVPIVCNTMWALTDFTAENGATRVCRGSQEEPGFPDPFGHPAGLVSAVMRRGSVL